MRLFLVVITVVQQHVGKLGSCGFDVDVVGCQMQMILMCLKGAGVRRRKAKQGETIWGYRSLGRLNAETATHEEEEALKQKMWRNYCASCLGRPSEDILSSNGRR